MVWIWGIATRLKLRSPSVIVSQEGDQAVGPNTDRGNVYSKVQKSRRPSGNGEEMRIEEFRWTENGWQESLERELIVVAPASVGIAENVVRFRDEKELCRDFFHVFRRVLVRVPFHDQATICSPDFTLFSCPGDSQHVIVIHKGHPVKWGFWKKRTVFYNMMHQNRHYTQKEGMDDLSLSHSPSFF